MSVCVHAHWQFQFFQTNFFMCMSCHRIRISETVGEDDTFMLFEHLKLFVYNFLRRIEK